jgi:hypothetical protein
MREEGTAVSIAQLCRWFGVARSTFYYRPPKDQMPKPPVIDQALEAKIRAVIDEEVVIGLRMITARIRRAAAAPVNKKKIHRILKLNHWQCRQKPQGHRPRVQGLGLGSEPAERAVGHRYDAPLLRPRWVVPPDGDHRLPRPHDRRLAVGALRDRGGGGRGPRGRGAEPRDCGGGDRADPPLG